MFMYYFNQSLILKWLLKLLLLFLLSSACYASNNSIETYSPVEQWIIDRISIVDTVNLLQYKNLNTKQIVSAKFIENLLKGKISKVKFGHRGIRLKHGIVQSSIDLRNVNVNHEVHLVDFKFYSDVNMSETHFTKGLVLNRDTFYQDINLSGINTSRLSLNNAHFQGAVDLSHAKISGVLEALGSLFEAKDRNISLSVNGGHFLGVLLNDSVFHKNVIFISAHVDLNLELKRTQFINTNAFIDFSNIEIGGTAFLNGVQVNGTLYFRSIKLFSLEMYGQGQVYYDDKNIQRRFTNPSIGVLNLGFSVINGEIEIEDSNIDNLNMESLTVGKSTILKKINI